MTSSRPTLSFPLGTALLLLVIFCLSGVFSCCYHWDKLRSLRRRAGAGPEASHRQERRSTAAAAAAAAAHTPPSPSSKLGKVLQEKEQSLPVIMPGDQIPKFMAWPRPCQPDTPINKMTMEKFVAVEVVIASATRCSATTSP